MDSRQKLNAVLNHKEIDGVCCDFGSTAVTGIAASTVAKLRNAILGDSEYRVKVVEPYQLLGEIDDQLMDALGIDVVGIFPPHTMFGFENKDWKEFRLFDGTEVLVPNDFVVKEDINGDLLIYPEGDESVAPTGRLPKNGFYFDAICRQEPIIEEELNPADNLSEYGLLSENNLAYFEKEAKRVKSLQKGGVVTIPGTAFGDIALVPATWAKEIKGIRDIEEWYVSTLIRRDYVYKVFEGQCELALQNLEKLASCIGDTVQAAFITGTDFGTQRGLFISVQAYRDLYKPFHQIINNWIHQHTNWKTFIHSCGGVFEMIPEFIDAGFDILNPVQCSAQGMDPVELKSQFGKDIVFWGGGVDTQKTLAFGTSEEVYEQVRSRIEIFNKNGGFVFNAIHNIQATTPIENILAMFKAIQDCGK
jgi:uroporphyrinogen decarboxylase-like protein